MTRREQKNETDWKNDGGNDVYVYGQGHVYVPLLHVMRNRRAVTYRTRSRA